MPTPCPRAVRRRAAFIIPAVVLWTGLAAFAQTEPPTGTVESGLAPELSVEEKIAQINAKILANPKVAENYNDLGVLYTEKADWALARDAFISAVQATAADGGLPPQPRPRLPAPGGLRIGRVGIRDLQELRHVR